MTAAVIGFHGRFPGAPNVDVFWDNLCEGRESVTFFDASAAIDSGETESVARDPNYVSARALAPMCLGFDHNFFGMSAGEALATDPQHRILLEEAWAALEHAGLGDRSKPARVGVFASCSMSSVGATTLSRREQGDFYEASIGHYPDFLAARVSHKLDLTGPSITVATACSSSLVAIHLARKSICSGECEVALAGGVSFQAPELIGHLYEEGGVLSPDGHCRPYDQAAAGTIGGTGAGVVVLKDLDRAIADGHTIWGVIRGSAVNNDGAGEKSFSAPRVAGQVGVISAALRDAKLEPAQIGYVEGHGTATALGDKVEVAALSSIFGELAPGSVMLGSVKSNIGHLDAAAGVAGFLKGLLATHEGVVPGTVHFRSPQPSLVPGSGPLRVCGERERWNGAKDRLAGISSFGIGGTNAHLIVGQHETQAAIESQERPRIFRLSARSTDALKQSRAELAAVLEEELPRLGDVERTLRDGRTSLSYRRAVVAASRQEAVASLRSEEDEPALALDEPGIGFMFSGQGSQRPGMARQLWDAEQDFRLELEQILRHLEPHLPHDLERLFLDRAMPREEIDRTDVAQPALFAFSCALARTWEHRGIRPRVLIGHSVGELAAAEIGGCLSLDEACRLVALRGELMHDLPRGEMASVLASPEEVEERLPPDLEIAAYNGPEACVVSGTPDAIQAFAEGAEMNSLSVRRLRTATAFHSRLVEPAMERFAAAASQVRWKSPSVPVISNVNGEVLGEDQFSSGDYWAQHMRRPVQFVRGLKAAQAQGCDLLLEVGPGVALQQLARLTLPDCSAVASAPVEGGLGDLSLPTARLWDQGLAPHQPADDREGRLIPLPTYPFQRVDLPSPGPAAEEGSAKDHRPRTRSVDIYLPRWRRSVHHLAVSMDHASTLVVGNGDGLGEQLTHEFIGAGVPAKHLLSGELQDSPGSVSDDRFWVQELKPLDGLGRIVHLLSLDADDPEDLQARRLAFHSVGAIARAVDEISPAAPIALDLVTGGVFDVTGGDARSPVGALTHGAGLGIRHDLEVVKTRTVDLGIEAGESLRAVAPQLVRHLRNVGEQTIALRRGEAWVREFPRVEDVPVPFALPGGADGCLLITGGTGGVGLALATRLASSEGPALVLISRSGHVADGRMDGLIASGAEIIVEQADVASESEMAIVMDRAVQRFGAIQGAFHAAGIGDHSHVVTENLERAEPVLAPKVGGAIVLTRLARRFGLQFICLCSSLASLEGARGATSYAAANAFLDALAACESDQDLRIVSVNLDVWRESGMAVTARSESELLSPFMIAGLSDDEGTASLLRCFSLSEPQAIVSAGPLTERIIPPEDSEDVGGRGKPGGTAKIDVASIWADVLGLEAVGDNDQLEALGVTSLQAMKVAARVRKAYGVRLPVRTVLRAKTPNELEKTLTDSV